MTSGIIIYTSTNFHPQQNCCQSVIYLFICDFGLYVEFQSIKGFWRLGFRIQVGNCVTIIEELFGWVCGLLGWLVKSDFISIQSSPVNCQLFPCLLKVFYFRVLIKNISKNNYLNKNHYNKNLIKYPMWYFSYFLLKS